MANKIIKIIIIQVQPPGHEELSAFDNNISDVSEPITIQDNEGSSQVVINVSPQRPLGIDCVHNTIGKQL